MSEDGLKFIFDSFSGGNRFISIDALVALSRATEQNSLTDEELGAAFTNIIEQQLPGEYVYGTGITLAGFRKLYAVCNGDVNGDVAAIRAGVVHLTPTQMKKAKFVFDYFSQGSGYLSVEALAALSKATEPGEASLATLADAFERVIRRDLRQYYVHGKGISLEGVGKLYLKCGGNLDADFKAVNEQRVDFFSAGATQAVNQEADPTLVKAALASAWSDDNRAQCGYQVIMSFGAASDSDGFDMDGTHVGSGFEVVQYMHTWLSYFMFGSMAEGRRHIYFDYYNH